MLGIAKASDAIYINLDQLVQVEKRLSDSGETSVRIYTVEDSVSDWITLYDEDAINFLVYLDYVSVNLKQWRKGQELGMDQ